MNNSISNLLKQLKYEDSASDNLGLYHGETGHAILYYLLAKYTGNTVFSKKAALRLDRIVENITLIDNLGFQNGLSGVGWAIEWLVQNSFLETNTDEVLEELDNELYRSVLYAPKESLSLATGTLGYLVYFAARYQSRNPGTHRYKNIAHEECLVILTDELEEKVSEIKNGMSDEPHLNQEQLIDLAHATIFLSEFLYLKINVPTVEQTLCAAIRLIDDSLSKNIVDFLNNGEDFSNVKSQLFFQYVAICYYIAGELQSINYWKERALNYMNITNMASSTIDKLSKDDLLCYIRNLALLSLYVPAGLERSNVLKIYELINTGSLSFSLANGAGNALISILGLLAPSLIGKDLLWKFGA